jgi:G protein beta subunit-like protein
MLGRTKQTKKAHDRYGLKCLFSPDSTYLATSSADGSIKIWSTNDLTLVSEHKNDKPGSLWIWDLAFTCDSEYLLSASSDKLARLWSVKTCTERREYKGHQKPVVCLAFCDTKI